MEKLSENEIDYLKEKPVKLKLWHLFGFKCEAWPEEKYYMHFERIISLSLSSIKIQWKSGWASKIATYQNEIQNVAKAQDCDFETLLFVC